MYFVVLALVTSMFTFSVFAWPVLMVWFALNYHIKRAVSEKRFMKIL